MGRPLPRPPHLLHLLYHLIYQSQTREVFDTFQLTALLEKSRTWNAKHGVTGLLLCTPDGRFMQVLEGEEPDVKRLYYDRIALDPRHFGCTILNAGPWVRRSFPGWSMGFLPAEPPELHSVPGFVELRSLRALLPGLAPNRPALVHLLLEFISRYDGSTATDAH